MTVHCPECSHLLSTEGNLPKFCSNCGASLAAVTASLVENPLDVTMEFSKGPAPSNPYASPRRVEESQTQRGLGPDANSVELAAGTVIGRFQIQRKLGAGGMGTVYEAVDQGSGQHVALKLLSKSVRSTDESAQRFQRESQIAASINHPRSTFVYGAGQHDQQFFISMELMTGGTLDDIIKRDGPLETGVAVDYVLDMIDGLRAAHEVGIVHRDLKPSNCFIDQTGRVKIGDFGLAKSFLSDSSLTQTGAFMGTPQYAAPEQLRTSEVDERADIYAIGGTLFYLLAGRPPFTGNAAQVISSIASETAPKISTLAPKIPKKLCRIIQQTLEKKPERRQEHLDELRESLLPFSTRGSTPADPGRRLAAFFLDILTIGIMMTFVSSLTGMLLQLFRGVDIQKVGLILPMLVGCSYFLVLEYWFATTLGKWLLGMRLTSDSNRPPSIISCFIRASLMPGLMYLAHVAPPLFMGYDPTEVSLNVNTLNIDTVIKQSIVLFLFRIAGWGMNAVLFVSARETNGYLGLHDILSGTRVVRVSGILETFRLQNIPITIPISKSFAQAMRSNTADETQEFSGSKQFGDVSVVGELGRLTGTDSAVFLGRDRSLDRDVWVLQSPPDSLHFSAIKTRVSRPTRMRILEVNVGDSKDSVITEAIKGMPLTEYLRETPSIDWRSFRPVLHELVIELERAAEENSLPEILSLGQVWIDDGGHPKLLEHAVDAVASGLNNEHNELDPWRNDSRDLKPSELIKAVLSTFIAHQVVPAHVLTFREEIDVLNLEPDGLHQMNRRLGELAELPSAWRWDDRLGSIAVSVGMEASILISLTLTFALLMSLSEPGGIALGVGVFVLLSCGILAIGALTSGGPVFRLSGVLVRENRSLQPATRLRCGIRAWLVWLPLIVGLSVIAGIMALQVSNFHNQVDTSSVISSVGAVLILGILCLYPLLGVYSILRPSRGIPDLICGTRLIRK